jgi:hypothetical protein
MILSSKSLRTSNTRIDGFEITLMHTRGYIVIFTTASSRFRAALLHNEVYPSSRAIWEVQSGWPLERFLSTTSYRKGNTHTVCRRSWFCLPSCLDVCFVMRNRGEVGEIHIDGPSNIECMTSMKAGEG